MHSNETQNKTSYTLISILKNLANPRSKTPSQVSSNQVTIASPNNDLKPGLQKITSVGNFLGNKKNSSGNIADLTPKQINKDPKVALITSPTTSVAKNLSSDDYKSSDVSRTVQSISGAVDSKSDAKESRKEKAETRKEPFITLSVEDYNEHKSAISLCKISKDGKLIASVDSQGIIKSKPNFTFFEKSVSVIYV